MVFLTATPQRLQNPLRESGLADSLVNWCDLATNCGIFYSRINLKLQVMTLKTHHFESLEQQNSQEVAQINFQH